MGGESGSGKYTRPFDLAWAEELCDHCEAKGVAFFLKRIGRNPVRDGKKYKLPFKRDVAPSGRFTDAVIDPHGGDWSEWPESLRVREFPRYFHDFRQSGKAPANAARPVAGKRSAGRAGDEDGNVLTEKDTEDFRRYDAIVRDGVARFMACGQELIEIHDRGLWRASGHKTWEGYCRNVAGMSKPHAHRIAQAARITLELKKSLPNGNDFGYEPISEAQVRPLRLLEDP